MKKIGCFILLLTLSVVFFACNVGSTMSEYDDSGYSVGNASFSFDDVKRISIVWITGNVDIITQGDNISIAEEDSKEKMRYKLENGELKIYFAKSKANIYNIKKKLTLSLPSSLVLNKLSVNVTSGNVEGEIVNAKAFECTAVNGNVELKHVSGEELTVKTTDGNVKLTDANFLRVKTNVVSGVIQALTVRTDDIAAESVSGNVTFADLTCKNVKVKCVSGNVMVGFSDKVKGYTLSAKVTNGNVDAKNAVKNDGEYVYNENDKTAATITVEVVNGNVGVVTP